MVYAEVLALGFAAGVLFLNWWNWRNDRQAVDEELDPYDEGGDL